jgi:hypothetical protein
MKRRSVSLRKALSDPKLLGNALAGDRWLAWRVLLIAAAGETQQLWQLGDIHRDPAPNLVH